MIKISETALNVLSEGLQTSGVKQGMGLRLKEKDERLTLELDIPKKGDRVVSHNERRVLIIDTEFEDRIGDALIDVEDTEDGPDLIVRNT